jgi:nucleoside-diphosphate-sugar epimerase
MKILHAVEFYPPSVGGAQTVVQQISERLAARGHEVTVVTSHLDARAAETLHGVGIVSFRASGNLVNGLRGEIDRYRDYVRHAARRRRDGVCGAAVDL